MTIINSIGISILAVLLLFITQKKGKRKSDYLLILTIALLAAYLFSDIWVRSGLTTSNFILQNLVSFYLFPVFLTYGLLLIDEGNELKKEWWWLGSFAFAFTLFIIIDFTFLTSYAANRLVEQYEDPSVTYLIFYKAHSVFVIVVLIWFLNKLKHYHKVIKDSFSFIEPIRLLWFRNFTWVYLLLNLLAFVSFLAYNFGYINNIDNVYVAINIALVISLFYLSYNGIRQYTVAEIYPEEHSINSPATPKRSGPGKDKSESEPKYQSSSLSKNEMEDIYQQIKNLFEKDIIYNNPELKLQNVAKQLNVTTHKVSQTINSKAQKPFYDFVNEYRVEHLKKLLTDPNNQKYTILALGIESGFNSKASLNRIFKHHTGHSPREVQKTHLIK